MTNDDETDDLQGDNPHEDADAESDDFEEDIEDLENQEGADDEDEDEVEIAPEPIVLTPEEQISDLKDQLLRALAENQNVRRRADRDRTDASKYAVTNFARDMLTVANNLRRTIDSAKADNAADAAKEASAADAATGQSEAPEGAKPSAAKALLDGVEMTERDLLASLERHGIKVISPIGEIFDHNFHQAIFEVETADQKTGVVVQVIQDGFVIGDRLLRPAMVGVAKAPAASAETESGDPDGESGGNLDTEA